MRDRVAIGLLIRGPMLGLEVDDDSDTMLAFGTIRLHRLAMRTQQVMCRNGRRETIAMPGREHPVQISSIGNDPRLVERHPHLHAVVEPAKHDRGVVGEALGDIRIEPAAKVVQRSGQVPVVERNHRLDVGLEQRVDETIVEIETCLIDASSP